VAVSACFLLSKKMPLSLFCFSLFSFETILLVCVSFFKVVACSVAATFEGTVIEGVFSGSAAFSG
jgi:hypothetical protein